VLLSALAQRTLLSTSVIFLSAGFAAGNGVLGMVSVSATDPGVELLIEVALTVVCSRHERGRRARDV
jgi:sodium/hydrogen antiporter